MANSNGIITAPVSFADVNHVLGTSHTDLAALCKDEHINKFARYKPIRSSVIGLLTEANRRAANHGIQVPDTSISSQKNLTAIQDAAGNDWEYVKPNGGSSSPYRLHDFGNTVSLTGEGYYHNAVPPIQVNYPRNGWTYTRGSNNSRTFGIYITLDPDDSARNLQCADFINSGLNLNEWTLIVGVNSTYFSQKVFEASGPILDDGEKGENVVLIEIPSGSGSYIADIYVCLYREISNNRYEFMPLPKQGDYNPEVMKLHIKDDATASGGGIEGDVFTETTASYALNGTYRPLSDFTDGGNCKYALRSSTGNLYMCLKLTNRSGYTKTINKTDFKLALDEFYDLTPKNMFNSTAGAGINSITVNNNATVTVYLEWEAIFAQSSYWNSSTKNSNWSFDLTRSGAYLVGSDMYVFKGTDGWVSR